MRFSHDDDDLEDYSNDQIKPQIEDELAEDEEEDAMSDYIDENFEMDETDEYWGVQHNPCHELIAHVNDIKVLNQK